MSEKVFSESSAVSCGTACCVVSSLAPVSSSKFKVYMRFGSLAAEGITLKLSFKDSLSGIGSIGGVATSVPSTAITANSLMSETRKFTTWTVILGIPLVSTSAPSSRLWVCTFGTASIAKAWNV